LALSAEVNQFTLLLTEARMLAILRIMESKTVYLNATIADVAHAAEVSKATVSNYLNGRTGKLSAQTRERIKAVVEQLGYTPSLGARRLSARTRSGTIGLLVRRKLADAFAEPFFAEVFRGVGTSFDASGIRGLVLTQPAGQERMAETDYLISLSRGIVDGFLIFDIEEHDQALRLFAQRKIPFVAFGQSEDDSIGPCVGSDHAAGVIQAAQWLLGRKHRRFALAGGNPRVLVSRHREQGLRSILVAAGLTQDALEIHATDANESPEQWLRRLLREHYGPSAFFMPQSWLREWHSVLAERPPEWPRAEIVLLDCFAGEAPSAGQYAHIEAPTAQVGRRGAELLAQLLATGQVPSSELYPTRFAPPVGE